jgi:branched-chain amino acid transport system ATP-binding protein
MSASRFETGGITTLLGRQRRRQDDDAARHLQHGAAGKAWFASTAGTSRDMPTEEVVRLRIAHVPEGRGTFTTLTVDENLRIAAYTRKDKQAVKNELDRVFSYFPRPQGTRPAAGRHAVGRRAADAGESLAP